MSHEYEYLGTPVNKTAGLVISRSQTYKPDQLTNQMRWKEPPQTRKVPADVTDLTGSTRGRLTVIGLLPDDGKHKKWLVRCTCGWYEARRVKAIRNTKNTQERCQECRHLARVKQKEIWRRTGKDVPLADL